MPSATFRSLECDEQPRQDFDERLTLSLSDQSVVSKGDNGSELGGWGSGIRIQLSNLEGVDNVMDDREPASQPA